MSGRKSAQAQKKEHERDGNKRPGRKDDTDRIEVERFFSRDKRCFGAALILTKLPETTLGSIALSVLVANLFGTGLPCFVFHLATPGTEGTPSSSWKPWTGRSDLSSQFGRPLAENRDSTPKPAAAPKSPL